MNHAEAPNLTGTGIRAEGMVSDVGLCNEMRTVSERYDWWRERDVRVMRLLELLFFPERKAPFEDLDPGCWRGSCKLVVEDFQDVKLCTRNLLGCVQRRWVCGTWRGVLRLPLAIGKWASVPRLTARPGSVLMKMDCGSPWEEDVEDVNVVVSPFRPHMGEVQELKREICTVRREKSGGNEVLQEANALLSVEPLSV